MNMDDIQFTDPDENFARKLQEEYDREVAAQLQDNQNQNNEDVEKAMDINFNASVQSGKDSGFLASNISPVDQSLEYSDPNPDIRILFLQFNTQFFWGKLSGIEVKWSPRMTLCAGLCVYEGRGGLCSVRLSLPLLKLRPRKDLVETLLHEMIHAYLFVTNNFRDHDDHGPQFKGHMHRINKATGANISIYHTFHDEVASYQQHWWRCDGPCQSRRPYYGYVKRAMNRAPSPRDLWWAEHKATCGGTYTKIKEPEGYGQKKGGKKDKVEKPPSKDIKDIRAFGGKGHVLGSSASKPGKSSNIGSSRNPATIFNINNTSQKNTIGTSSTSSSASSKATTNSVIINGVLQRKTGNVSSSSLFSEIQSHAKFDDNVASQPHENGTSSVFQETSRGRTGLDDEDDDLWETDIDNIESLSLSSLLKRKDKMTESVTSDSCKLRDMKSEKLLLNFTKSGNGSVKSDSVNSDRNKSSNSIKRDNKNAFKIKKARSPLKDRRKKTSVCKGSVFFNDKIAKQKKRKYVLDYLDSNDGLWDIPVKSTVKLEPDVSQLKNKLKGYHIKDDGDNAADSIRLSQIKSENNVIKDVDLSRVKSENYPSCTSNITNYYSSSSNGHAGGDGLKSNLMNNGEINIKIEKRIKVEPDERDGSNRTSRKLLIDEFVDLSDFDDDEFDFVSSERNLFGNKSSRSETSRKSTSSQKSIGSFFSLGGRKSTTKKSIFSGVKEHICKLDTSTCSKCEDKNESNEDLPDISSDDNSLNRSHDKTSTEPAMYDNFDLSEDDNDNPNWPTSKSKNKLSLASTTTITKSKKISSSGQNIKNYFVNPSPSSSSSGSKGKTSLNTNRSNNFKNTTSQKSIMVVHDISDSSDSENDFVDSIRSKKRSSYEAFEHDATVEEVGNKSYGLPSKVPKHSAERMDDSSSDSSNERQVNEGTESPSSGNNVACPVCTVLVPSADINSHLDMCIQ